MAARVDGVDVHALLGKETGELVVSRLVHPRTAAQSHDIYSLAGSGHTPVPQALASLVLPEVEGDQLDDPLAHCAEIDTEGDEYLSSYAFTFAHER
jgi:hypothetical protein